jgi:hypothetical protein
MAGTTYQLGPFTFFMANNSSPQNAYEVHDIVLNTGVSKGSVRRYIKECSDFIAKLPDTYPPQYFYVPNERSRRIIEKYLSRNASARMEINNPAPLSVTSFPNRIPPAPTTKDLPIKPKPPVAVEKVITPDDVFHSAWFETKAERDELRSELGNWETFWSLLIKTAPPDTDWRTIDLTTFKAVGRLIYILEEILADVYWERVFEEEKKLEQEERNKKQLEGEIKHQELIAMQRDRNKAFDAVSKVVEYDPTYDSDNLID